MREPPKDDLNDPKNNRSERDQIENSNERKLAEDSLGDALLEGADEIALFMYGDRRKRRKIYYQRRLGRIPIFAMGAKLCARKSTLRAWIEEQEKRGSRDFRPAARPPVTKSPSRPDDLDAGHGRGQNPEGIGPGQPS